MKRLLIGLTIFISFTSIAKASDLLGPELSCVADGIKQATGGKVEPSERWIALLGSAAQEFHGPRAIQRGGEQARNWLQTRVISMVQTYGFCSAFPRKAEDAGYSGIFEKNDVFAARKYFLGQGRTSFSQMDKKEQVKYLEMMGFKEPGLLTKNVKPLKDLFNVEGDWWTNSIQNRKKDFTSYLERLVDSQRSPTSAEATPVATTNIFVDNGMGQGLKECLSQVDSLQVNNPIFNSKHKDHRKASTDFCTKVAASCGIDGSSFCNIDGVRSNSSGSPASSTGGTAGDFFGTK